MIVADERSLNGGSGFEITACDRELSETVIDPIRDDGWDSLIRAHSDCTIFHSTAWARALFKAYGHRALYCCYRLGEKVAALVPIIEVKSSVTGCRGVSVPFADLCAPLVFDPNSRKLAAAKLIDLAHARGWRYLEIRGAFAAQQRALPAETFYGHSLDLRRSITEIFEGFSSSVRRAIRKAQRNGLTVSTTNKRAAITEYYRLHSLTRRRHGSPPQPLSFFLALYDEVISRGLGFVVLASKGSQVIAGAVFLHFGGNAVFKYGASDPKFQELRGNNLVFWEAIQRLASAGCATLHFGRTSLESESLRRFKLGWGTIEERVEYVRLQTGGESEGTLLKSEHHPCTALFRRLPIMVNRWVGALLYPHLD